MRRGMASPGSCRAGPQPHTEFGVPSLSGLLKATATVVAPFPSSIAELDMLRHCANNLHQTYAYVSTLLNLYQLSHIALPTIPLLGAVAQVQRAFHTLACYNGFLAACHR